MPTWIWKNVLKHRQSAKGPQGDSIPGTFAKRPALLPTRTLSIIRPCQLTLKYGHCTSLSNTCSSRLCLELLLKSLVGCCYFWHPWLQTLLFTLVHFLLWKLTSFHLGLEYLQDPFNCEAWSWNPSSAPYYLTVLSLNICKIRIILTLLVFVGLNKLYVKGNNADTGQIFVPPSPHPTPTSSLPAYPFFLPDLLDWLSYNPHPMVCSLPGYHCMMLQPGMFWGWETPEGHCTKLDRWLQGRGKSTSPGLRDRWGMSRHSWQAAFIISELRLCIWKVPLIIPALLLSQS